MKRRTEHFTYELVRARRRSMSLKVELDGTITVRAPFRTPPETADWFVESHRDWIEVRLRAGEQILAVPFCFIFLPSSPSVVFPQKKKSLFSQD